jgi:FkbM family methyltransferase
MKAITNLYTFFSEHPLSRDDPLKAWVRFVSWQVRSRLQEEVLVPWIEGQILAVRRGMSGATGNIYVGLHEFVDMMVPLHFLRAGDLFLDIGANVGTYTILASGICRATTWAFEPDPDTAKHLRRNIALNDLDTLVGAYQYAIGCSAGEVPFSVGLDTMNKVAAPGEGNVRMVRQEQVDVLVGAAEPAMLKIDVEGYEEKVLQGATNTLGKPSLKVIEIETVTPRVHQLLEETDFKLAFYNPFRRELSREPIGMKSSNSLYVRDREFVGRRLKEARPIKILDRTL